MVDEAETHGKGHQMVAGLGPEITLVNKNGLKNLKKPPRNLFL